MSRLISLSHTELSLIYILKKLKLYFSEGILIKPLKPLATLVILLLISYGVLILLISGLGLFIVLWETSLDLTGEGLRRMIIEG